MRSVFGRYNCLNGLREVIGSNTPSTVHTAVLKRRWHASACTHHVSLVDQLQSSLFQRQKRMANNLAFDGYIMQDEQLAVPREPPPQFFDRPVFEPDDLFHSFSNSPIPDIRRRAAFMKVHAYCPHPDHQRTRIPTSPDDHEARKVLRGAPRPPAHVRFECPDCGIPVSCSEEHWADDYERHMDICDTLRQINEDDHDIRSGRPFYEFEYPGPSIEEALVNLLSWDTYLYTRDYLAINSERSMRQVTKLLTYPVTIGSIIHELSPYNIKRGGRLTVEGLKSLTGK